MLHIWRHSRAMPPLTDKQTYRGVIPESQRGHLRAQTAGAVSQCACAERRGLAGARGRARTLRARRDIVVEGLRRLFSVSPEPYS